MTITAKYAGKCRVCGEAIVVGEKIEWSKSGGARHTSCAGKSTSAPSRRQQYGQGCGECARLGRMCDRCAFDEQ
jgi:hypothetical protein